VITIVVIALISAIVPMYIVNSKSNVFARSSHHDREDDNANHRYGCIYQKHATVDQKHISTDDKHGSVQQ
jgi:hypothetical protein